MVGAKKANWDPWDQPTLINWSLEGNSASAKAHQLRWNWGCKRDRGEGGFGEEEEGSLTQAWKVWFRTSQNLSFPRHDLGVPEYFAFLPDLRTNVSWEDGIKRQFLRTRGQPRARSLKGPLESPECRVGSVAWLRGSMRGVWRRSWPWISPSLRALGHGQCRTQNGCGLGWHPGAQSSPIYPSTHVYS